MISKDEHKLIYREIVDLVGTTRFDIQKLAARFGISMQELQEQVDIKSSAEKLQLLVDAFKAAEDALKDRKVPTIKRDDKDLNKKAARQVQRDLNKHLSGVYDKLVAMAKKREMKLQEFRAKLNQKEVVELFDYLIDAIELGQDGPKLEKKPLRYKILESIPWRIKVDEADEIYYKIKPHEVEYYDALESIQRKFNAMNDEDYHAKEPEYRKRQKELRDKLTYKIGRHCEAFSQIDPYLQRRGQSCGKKCTPIPVCKEIGL